MYSFNCIFECVRSKKNAIEQPRKRPKKQSPRERVEPFFYFFSEPERSEKVCAFAHELILYFGMKNRAKIAAHKKCVNTARSACHEYLLKQLIIAPIKTANFIKCGLLL